MVSPLAKHVEFYQQLLRSTGNYEQLGHRLIQLSEQAHSLRQFDKVKEIGLLLSNFPMKRYQTIGYYFLAVAANSVGNGDQEKARRLFELVVDTASDTYKVKSIMSLAALARNKGDIDSAFYFCRETIKAGGFGLNTLQAVRGIAVLKAAEGYHESAILDLEKILPAMRLSPPHIYLDCLNSYAVELSEMGRLREAENVASLVVASPFATHYPEWQETLSDITALRTQRSITAVPRLLQPEPSKPADNILPFSSRRSATGPKEFSPSLRIRIASDFMKDNLHRRISLAELGGLVNLSPSHFSRLFRIETGLSPGEYLKSLRMEKARELLATSLLSIKEVMAAVGYTNRRHFLHHFKTLFGPSPSEYRKQASSPPL